MPNGERSWLGRINPYDVAADHTSLNQACDISVAAPVGPLVKHFQYRYAEATLPDFGSRDSTINAFVPLHWLLKAGYIACEILGILAGNHRG